MNKNAIRNIIYILTFFALLTACSTKSKDNDKAMSTSTKEYGQQAFIDKTHEAEWIDNSTDCEFVYDTITNEKYNMHLGILDKFNNKEKRGYFFSAERDTINKFLYHQDIAAFMLGLDPTEQGIYKRLTNKVVFLILEHEPKMLDFGLTQWTREEKQLDYFMEHVSHPTCNTMPIDSIIDIIKRDMDEPHDGARKVKQMLLERLEQSKK